jgi:hydroxylamine reductase (hybrid-cluster protein)
MKKLLKCREKIPNIHRYIVRNFFTAIGNRNYLLKHVIEGKIEGRIEMAGRR